jgi:Flp pilus assembly protein TadG
MGSRVIDRQVSTGKTRSFAADRKGQFSIAMAVLSVPIIAAVAMAIDFSRLLNAKNAVQNAQDSAMLAGVKLAQNTYAEGASIEQSIARGEERATAYFVAETFNNKSINAASFTPKILINARVVEGNGTYDPAELDSTFSKVLGVFDMKLKVTNQISVTMGDHVEIHFIVDNSPSMGVGAAKTDIAIMAKAINCAFACHAPSDAKHWYSTADQARTAGAKLRIDIVKESVSELIDDIKSAGTTNIKVAIHTFSNTLRTVQKPTNDYAALQAAISAVDLNGEWGEGGTGFAYSLDAASKEIGQSEDGKTASGPKKIALLFTDGLSTMGRYTQTISTEFEPDPMIKDFAPVLYGPGAWAIQGFDPNYCKSLKAADIELFTINTEYVIPTVGTDNDARFQTIKDVLKKDIKKNLEKCATSSGHFYRADEPEQIFDAVKAIGATLRASTLAINK